MILYDASPFIYIIFATALSFCLGLLLVSVGLVFAGSVLIIVNSGAIAMVFLFVCVLSSRNVFVNRLISVPTLAGYLFVFFVAVLFSGALLQTIFSETNICNSLTPVINKTPMVLLETRYSTDYST